MKKKKFKSNILLIVSLLVLILICIVFYIVSFITSNNSKTIKFYKTLGNYSALSGYYISEDNTSPEEALVRIYNCKTKKCAYFDVTGENVVIYDNNKYYIYNFIKNKKTEVNLENYNYQKIEILEFNKNIYALVIRKNDKSALYLIEDKKYITDFEYTTFWLNNEDMYNKGYIFASTIDEENYKKYILNLKTGKIAFNNDEDLDVLSNNGHLYFLSSKTYFNNATIYNDEFKPLFNDQVFSLYGITKEGNVLVANVGDEIVKEYNSNGLLLSTGKTYKSINMINDNIIVVNDNGYLKVVDYEGNTLLDILEFSDNLSINNSYSSLSNKRGNIIIYDKNLKEHENGYCKNYSFDLETKEIKISETNCRR